ncbi:hypothetical protein DRQ09_04600 [candidate division KSB1 bacterium]|nr:MAG: hypothetical protein DRQ09_04600 [candidate division KSB1 bacterium]
MFKRSLFISVIIHIGAIFLLSLFSFSRKVKTEYISFNVIKTEEYKTPPVKKIPKKKRKRKVVKRKTIPKKILIPEKTEEKIIAANKKNILEVPKDSTEMWYKDIKEYFKSLSPIPTRGNIMDILDFNATEILESSKDSAEKMNEIMKENLDNIVYSREKLESMGIPDSDPAGKMLRDRYSNPVMPIDALIGTGIKLASKLIGKIFKKEEKSAVEILDLTFDEIEVMKIIWKKGKATTLEVYERLPRGSPIRMETLKVLTERLKKKGIINIKKGQYEDTYFPRVSREKIIDYYTLYLAELNSRSNSDLAGYNIENYKKVIREKIRILSIY